jgi:hypothetical protein
MPKVIKSGRCRTVIGHELFPGVPTKTVYRPASPLKNLMSVPVTWGDQTRTMYFQAQTHDLKRKARHNQRATDLFAREGFRIYGPVIIEQARATWPYLRFAVPEDYVRSRIDHLTLGRYDIVPAGYGGTVVDILVENDPVIPVLKMALAI